MATMPNVIGMQYQNALAAMVTAGVRVVPLGYFQTDPVTLSFLKAAACQPGYVINQVPAAGHTVQPNAAAVLTVSSFPLGVGSDSPVTQPPPDALYDQPGSAFILDESKLK